MTFAAPSLALMLLALAGFLALAWAWERGALTPRRHAALLALVTAVAFPAHLGLLHRGVDGAAALRVPPPHFHELFHYYLGTRYFAELGYDGLYDAAVLADFEDAPEDFPPQRAMRDLATNRLVRRGTVVARADAIRAPFAPARWQAFKRDLAVFREGMGDTWGTRAPVYDHGYNGTPLVTALLGGLAAQPFLDTREFLGLVSLLDPYLLALLAAAIAGLEGAAVGLTFLFFAFANPLNEYGFTGGGYLRLEYLLALAAGLVALRRGWRATSGVLLAAAALLRLFPGALYACLLLRDLAGPGWRARLRANARLHAGFAAGALAILALTSFVPTPDGRNPWLACAENIRLHTSVPSANRVSLSALFGYAPEKDRLTFGLLPAALEPAEPGAPAFDWIAETQRVLAERRWYHAAAALALVAVALASLRRLGEAETLFPALLVVFAILPVSHYYWALLALVPLGAPRSARIQAALAATCCAFAVCAWPGLFDAHIDLRFALYSLALLAFLLCALALATRARRPAVAALAGLALALGACERAPEDPAHAELPIDGNRYASRTFAFAIEKPEAWSFLPDSSLLRDGDERAADAWQRWENLRRPTEVPLVAIAPSSTPRIGVDPILRVFILPIEPGESPRGVQLLTNTRAEDVIMTFSTMNRGRFAGYEMLQEATPIEVGGLQGSGVRLRYQLAEPQGAAPQPVEERLWHVRRGEEYWYFSMLGPDPMPAEMAAQLEAILASSKLDS